MIFEIAPLLSGTTEVIKEFINLKKDTKREEIESDEWKELERAYFKHLKWRFSYPQKTFGQQKAVSIAIGVLVILLILSGIVFSFWQLKYALEVGNLSQLSSQVSVETAGKITINSSILGAVVLVISLAFFYLYLTNVFKIEYPTPPSVGLEDKETRELLLKKLSLNIKPKGKNMSDNFLEVMINQQREISELKERLEKMKIAPAEEN